MTNLLLKLTNWVTAEFFHLLGSRTKAAFALAVIGFTAIVENGVLVHRTAVVIIIAVLALLDTLARFGVMPRQCSTARPCADCRQFAAEHGVYAGPEINTDPNQPIYGTDPEDAPYTSREEQSR